MQAKMSLKGSKSYKRIYFSVILLLMTIMLLFSVFFYNQFIKRQKNEIDQKAHESVERIGNWMNTQYQEMMRIVLEINGDGVFSYAPITSKSQKDDLLEQLSRYVSGNGFLQDMSYESMLDEKTVYSSQGIFERENFKKYIYDIWDEFDEREYLTRRKHRVFAAIPANQLVARYYPQKAMAYVYGLPLMSDSPKGLITFYVQKNNIDSIVNQFIPCDVIDVRFYERDTLVYSLTENESIPDDAVIVSVDGSLGEYRYELFAEPNVLYSDYHATQLFYFFMLGIMCVVIVLASWVVAVYNYQPLHKLVIKYAGAKAGKMDEYELLNELVEDTIEQKHEIQKKLFISNVVWEQYETEESLYADAQEAGIFFEYPEFVCCALEYPEDVNPDELSACICEVLDTPHTMAVCAKRDGGKRLTIIINYTGTLDADKLAEQVFREMKNVRVGMGTRVQDTMRLSESYQRARRALHEAQDLGIAFVQYDSLIENESVIQEKKESTNNKIGVNTALLNTILECMKDSLSDTGMSLEFIAGKCGVSASYLVRYFKSCMDMTPMQYVDSLRMDIARNLLITTSYSLRQIVEQCGYLDESNFARKFKKIEGITPMNYRKLNWKEN